MNAWSRLPNAAHIDRVIASVESHPEVWGAIWHEARYGAWLAARSAIRHEARYEGAWLAARLAWPVAATGPILALIAYDDAAKYLDMSSDKLKIYAILSEEPAAVLMLSAVIAFEKINELDLIS
jgi:hypothetical protein